MGVELKVVFALQTGSGAHVRGHSQEIVRAQFKRLFAGSQIHRSRIQREAAVGRIDEGNTAVAADGNVAAGAAAAEHKIVVFELLAAEIDGRLSGGSGRNGDRAVFQREVLIQCHVEVFELRDFRAGVAFLRCAGLLRAGQIDAAFQKIEIAGDGLALGGFHAASREPDVALDRRTILVGPDDRAGQSGVGLA